MVAVWTARQQTKIAIAQSARKKFPTVLPNACFMTYGRPSSPTFLSRMCLLAIDASRITRPPMSAAAPMARMIAGGALRRGSLVSSASVPAVSNPYMTYALSRPPTSSAPK